MKKSFIEKQMEELYSLFLKVDKRIDKIEKRIKIYDDTEKELRPCLFELDKHNK